jgi:hypothetical protein
MNGWRELNIHTLLCDETLPDGRLLNVQQLCAAFGEPREPISPRTLSRYRVQHPEETINHALGGAPGIGKDTILSPIGYAVGLWNFTEVTRLASLARKGDWPAAIAATAPGSGRARSDSTSAAAASLVSVMERERDRLELIALGSSSVQ